MLTLINPVMRAEEAALKIHKGAEWCMILAGLDDKREGN